MLPEGVNGFGYYEFDEFRAAQPAPYEKPVYSLENLYVTDKYFYFSFNYLTQINWVVYSPANGGLRYGRIEGTDKMLLTGSIVCIAEDDRVVMSKDANMLYEQLKVIKEHNKKFIIPQELLDVKPEDNPVLMFYKVKDE